jgi:hypothetical protein
MSLLKDLTKALKNGRKTIDSAREVIAQTGATLESGAALCKDAGEKIGAAAALGEKIGSDFARGVQELAGPKPQKVDVKVVGVKQNGR